MSKISIIVPVYKVEPYLGKCIESILAQTFIDFELILVDDGSPDSCGKMCDEFAQMDRRIVVVHKSNGGLSSARNAGLDIARGEYIGFVDSDDYVEPDMYEVLYNNLVKYDADIAECGTDDHYYNKIQPQKVRPIKVCDTLSALEEILHGRYTTISVADKLYKCYLFKDQRFPLGKRCEDIFIIVELFLNAKKVVFDTKVGYHYVHRSNSITTESFSEKDMDAIEACKRNATRLNTYPALLDVCAYQVWWSYRSIVSKLAIDTYESRQKHRDLIKECSRIIRNDIYKIVRSKYIYHYQMWVYLLIAFLPSLYMKIYRHKIKII